MIIHGQDTASFPTRGYALITALVFLIILSTIGIFTLRSTALEIMMGANNNKSVQAFESAEAARAATSRLIQHHLEKRGWPESAGGTIDDGDFGRPMPAGLTLQNEGDGPRNWYEGSFHSVLDFSSLDFSKADARYQLGIEAGSARGFALQGSSIVSILHKDIQAGSNNAMSSGYEGLGEGASNGGASVFFYVVAQGQDPTGKARRCTAAIYRYIAR